MKFTIATRGSKLALYQANHVRDRLSQSFPQHQWELRTFTTTGDKFLDRPLSEFGGKGAFLKEIEEALLARTADLAVHSLKDVPATITSELELCAFLPREDPRDVWVTGKESFRDLPSGKRVGTSSLRRTVLLKYYRPDLHVEMLRGNLDTRIRKLREGQYDAIIVAAAGLHRLELFDESIMEYLHEGSFIPAIGQGTMVVQSRKADCDLAAMIAGLNDGEAETAAMIERNFLAFYEGGCHLPIGGHARTDANGWRFRAFIGGVKSLRIIQDEILPADPLTCSSLMYERLQALGAQELLDELI